MVFTGPPYNVAIDGNVCGTGAVTHREFAMASKAMRMSAQSAKIEGGLVHIPERAPWLDELKTDVLQFPVGRYDDRIDSMSQALGWFEHRNANRLIVRQFSI